MLLPFRVIDFLPEKAAALQRPHGNFLHMAAPHNSARAEDAMTRCSLIISGCQKTCLAEGFGGKDSVKGNRQGFLSRSITRRRRVRKQFTTGVNLVMDGNNANHFDPA